MIATPDEWAELTLRLPCREAAAVCFSAKEAFHKAWFPATRRHLDFREVRVSVDGDRFEVSLAAPAVPSLGGRRSWQGNVRRTPQYVAAALRIPR